MKLLFSGIQIDLLCSQLALSMVPEELDPLDPNNLKNIDDQSIRSLNGKNNLSKLKIPRV